MKLKAAIMVVFSCACVLTCTHASGLPAGDAAVSSTAHELAQGNNAFALSLFKQLRAADGNLFLSPYSIRTALAMTCAGARGTTAAQMKDAMRIGLDDSTLHKAFADSITALNTAGGTDYEMSVANSLWGDNTSAFLQQFIDINKNFYGGNLERLDFKNDTEHSRQRINAWVEEKTRQKIKNLLAPGTVLPDTRLVLVNAVYFKGLWSEQFDKKLTKSAPFYCAGGRIVEAPLMTFDGTKELPFYSEDGLKVIELGYRGDDISMLVVLPGEAGGLAAIEENMDETALNRLIAGLRTRSVQVFLPRFTMTWGATDIVPELKALGMRDAFDADTADFSGIDGTRQLMISGVVHKAFVDVNEEGTEAAAATGIIMRMTAMPAPPEIFRADRPFLFLIREKTTGAILFIGRMSIPEKN